MPKRGQVTVFVIVGMLILFAAVAFFFLVQHNVKKQLQEQQPSEFPTELVRLLVENCLEKTTKEGLQLISQQGGYYSPAQPSRDLSYIVLPYYWEEMPTSLSEDLFQKELVQNVQLPYAEEQEEGTSHLPPLSVIEKELSSYIVKNMDDCVAVERFEQQGFAFERKLPSATTKLDKQVRVKLTYPLKIKKGQATKELTQFTSTIPFDFEEVYSLLQEMMEEQQNTPHSIPLGFIHALALEHQFQYVTTNLEKNPLAKTKGNADEILLTFQFQQELILGQPYLYSFLTQYQWQFTEEAEEEEEEDTPRETLQQFTEKKQKQSPKRIPPFFAIASALTDAEEQEAILSDWNNQQYLESLQPEQLLQALQEDPSLFENSLVIANFESRLASSEFVNQLNANRETLNAWAETKGISFGDFGALERYENGEVITKGKNTFAFTPELFLNQGATVDVDGSLCLRNGICLGKGQAVAEGKSIVILGREAVIDASQFSGAEEPSLVVKGGTLFLQQEKEGEPQIEVRSDDPFRLSRKNGLAVASGKNLNFAIRQENEIKQYRFSGDVALQDIALRGKSLVLSGKNPFIVLNKDGKTLREYTFQKEAEFVWDWTLDQTEGVISPCSTKRNCIIESTNQKDVNIKMFDDTTLTLTSRQEEVLEAVHVSQIKTQGTFTFNDKKGPQFVFSKRPVIVRGSIFALSTKLSYEYIDASQYRKYIEINYYDPENAEKYSKRALRFTPTEQGIQVEAKGEYCNQRDGVPCPFTAQGILTESTLQVIENMREAPQSDEKVQELIAKYGGIPPQRIVAYFNDYSETYLIQSIKKAAERSQLDPGFLAAVTFKEGLILWVNGVYYSTPDESIDGYTGLGADRFGIEVEELKKRGLLRADFDAKSDFREPPHKEENPAGEYYVNYERTNEAGDTVLGVTFQNIEYGLEAVGAMVKLREEFVKQDLRDAGIDPKKLGKDAVEFWTYYYYNGGSDPTHGDMLGIGKRRLLQVISQAGKLGYTQTTLERPVDKYGIPANRDPLKHEITVPLQTEAEKRAAIQLLQAEMYKERKKEELGKNPAANSAQVRATADLVSAPFRTTGETAIALLEPAPAQQNIPPTNN